MANSTITTATANKILTLILKQIMVASTAAMLFAGRFGLAPSANRKASAGLKLEDRDSGLQTGDPAGFTGADTLACGAVGHVIGVGVVLGLRALGAI
jgi:photosystem I subunit 10